MQVINEALAHVRRGANLWSMTAHQRGDMASIKFRRERPPFPWGAFLLAAFTLAAAVALGWFAAF